MIGFAAMVMIIQPFKMIKTPDLEDGQDSAAAQKLKEESNHEILGDVLALMAAVAGALAIIFVRKVSQDLHNSVIGFYYTLGNLIFSPLWSFV